MRITGGKHRSRSLKAPRGDATRPTSDRVREALFGILDARGGLVGLRILDAYAGTGALGLEALSRGAAHATFVERGREALDALRANVEALGVKSETTVVAAPVERASRLLEPRSIDVLFADPPYALVTSGVALRALEQLVARGVLRPDACVVLEHPEEREVRPEGRDGGDEAHGPEIRGLARIDTRRYGDTCLSFYVPSPSHEE
jgi:16S rRNA (guanine966-N2)-methyltransferase